jgi:Uma2 family endonuclease
VVIPSPSNDPEALREECRIYLALGAEEAWIVDPVTETVEIYAAEGLQGSSRLAFDFAPLWARLR